MSSPTNWIIASGAVVHKGDVVVAVGGCRARITAVNPDNGYPVLVYESGSLAGAKLPTHPINIRAKVEAG